MSSTTIVGYFWIDGVLTDPDSIVLSDSGGTYGVKRTDTDAVVVADGTAMTQVSTGVYSHTFTDPAPGLTYQYVIEAVYGGVTSYEGGTQAGGVASEASLYSYVDACAPYAGPAPLEVIKQQLRDVARHFLTETEVWGEDLDAIDSVADQAAYSLTHGYSASILRVPLVTIDETITTWRYTVNPAVDTLTLDPAPTTDDMSIVPSVVFKPDFGCTTYPSWLLQRWGPEIAHGVLEQLKAMRGAPWYAPDEVPYWGGLYRQHIAQARRETMTQRASGDLRVIPRRFV